MKVSVSAYSFSQYIRKNKMTQFDTIAKAKELGFEAIEFTDIDGFVSLEYEGAEDCIAGISRSLANIRQMLSALS